MIATPADDTAPHQSTPSDKPVFWTVLFLAAALWGAFGAPANGWPYCLAAGMAGAAVVELLRPHLARS